MGASQEDAYLLGLRLQGRRVAVVGGGAVAARRVPRLLAVGADVLLISPTVTPALEELAAQRRIGWLPREYQPGDCADAWLVVACTDRPQVNAAVADEAEQARTWCVRADDASASTAWTPAGGRVGDTSVAVLTGDPRHSAAIRDAITTGLQAGTISARHYRRRAAGVALVGGGPGDPGLITVRGRRLLAEADVVVADRLGPRELLAELPPDVTVIDAGKVPYRRQMSQDEINEALIRHARDGKFVVRLKGGDPFVFGRGGEEMLACLRAGVPVTVVPGISSAIGVPTASGLPVTHRGVAQAFHVISVHVPPGDERSTVDWPALARSDETLVLLMALERIGTVARALIEHGKRGNCPVSVIADGTMPTQRTIYSTLEDIERRLAEEGVRPPAVVVIGGVVTIAAELAGLGRALGGGDDGAPGAAPAGTPLARDNLTSINPGGTMEGKGMTAEEAPSPGDNGEQGEKIEGKAPGGEMVPARGAVSPADGNDPSMSANWQRPRVRVDARLLEATLLNLRKRIAAIPLVFDIPGAEEVTAERAKLISQIDDYLLPRVRESAAPLLVALVGSTGAGKSTLVNSIVGTQVSLTGVRRPTTNSPVLACHPDDIHWFAENMFLPTLPRVRQEGLARPGRDGLLVLAASEGMTKGIALLDTPDIDSVVRAHYDFAYQFLDASDLWLFMTSASRYADAPVWELLQHARERGAALGVVLSRVPPSHRTELVAHFNAMLDANGIQAENRFVIPETGLVDGYLPDDIFQPVREWLEDTAKRTDRRVAVLSQTMAGMLDTFKTRVPRLAAHVDAQVVLRTRLRGEAEAAYATALAEFDAGTRDGRLLAGEVLARWQDYAASGDLAAALRAKRSIPAIRRGRRARTDAGAARLAALDAALRTALQSLVVSVADRAAEQVARMWRDNQGGAVLISDAEASRARDERAKAEFESAFGSSPAGRSSAKQGAFDRASADLSLRVSRAVSAWQDQLMRLMSSGGAAFSHGGPRLAISAGSGNPRGEPDGKATGTGMQSSGASKQAGPVSVITLVALLGQPGQAGGFASAAQASAGEPATEIDARPQETLAALVGSAESAVLLARARQDLNQRVGLLLDEEMLRFSEVIDEVGPIDSVAAVRLYQAEYSLEAAR